MPVNGHRIRNTAVILSVGALVLAYITYDDGPAVKNLGTCVKYEVGDSIGATVALNCGGKRYIYEIRK